MNLKKSMLSLLFLFAVAFAEAQQKYELTVQQAVDLAFKNVIELKNAQIDYQIQEAKNKEIFGQALPQIVGNAGVNHYLQLPKILFPDGSRSQIYDILVKEQVLPNGTTIPAPVIQQISFQQPWNSQVGATVTQLLFQPDVFVGLQARQTALDLSASNVEQVKERIKDSAYKRYYAILIAEKQLYYLKQGVQRLEKLYHDDSILYKNGFAERLDLDKVQVQLTNLKTQTTIVENAVQLSYGALKFALGLSQKDVVVLKEDLSIDKIKENILVDTFRYEDRAEIRTLGYAKRLQELDLKRYRLGYFPTVAAQGNYSINGQGQNFITDKSTTWIRSSYIGLSMNLPIFDGFQRKYKVKQAALNVQKVDNTISLVKQGIDLEQFATKETLKNYLLNLDAQQRNMELAERVYNTTKIKFENGLGSSFEVLQADSEFQTAQANYFNALYNAIVARISYQKSLGKLQ
jgi:outer membrane protein